MRIEEVGYRTGRGIWKWWDRRLNAEPVGVVSILYRCTKLQFQYYNAFYSYNSFCNELHVLHCETVNAEGKGLLPAQRAGW